ncbi:RNA polymerase II elongation factor ELL-like [Brienomyrus brachyistius]|uniref:RNA polymerase II elongation factor ELL-like n=1 Tax=Brienomyrus brachyistius TaxID=42636 RepID=UPI0020B1884F|nr:RNA polymerase II elongation factor ELL-like [Brienomyrus brachyistius]
MAALEEERRYGLSCARVSDGSSVSVFHVKLTDSALRAFENYQNRRNLSAQPSIRFAGSQGKICVPRPENPGSQQVFTFYLSNVGKDNPQGSFDCIRQHGSPGGFRLDGVGTIHDKITVCASDDSYEKARQSMTQAEEETRSRGAIVIKPGGRYPGKKVHIRKPPAPSPADVAPCRQVNRPVIISSAMKKNGGVVASVQARPLRERLTHLLALKPYSRPELVLRLQKDGLSAQDRHALDSLLQQVADLNSRDNSFTLKDCLFKEVQKDWPGYSEGDQQLLKRILVRKLCQSQNAAPAPGEDLSNPPKGVTNTVLSQSPPQKRSGMTDFIDPLANKKPRISHLAGKMAPSLGDKLSSGQEAGAVQGGGGRLPGLCPPPPESTRPCDPLCDVSNDSGRSRRDREARGAGAVDRLGQPIFGSGPASEPLPVRVSAPLPPSQPGLAGAPPEPPPAPSALHTKSKKKSKKNKDKDRSKDREKEKKGVAGQGAGPRSGCDLTPSTEGLTGSISHSSTGRNGTCHSTSALPSTPEKADYLLKYTAICSHEQRQSYKNDFNVEYSEYRDLHARIEAVTRQFTVLDSQLRQLQPGSDKYKTIHNQILQEYRKIKKTNPNYTEEKNRCEYLHSKLAYIKKLIAEYDQQRLQGCY